MKAYGIMGGTFDPVHNGHLSMAGYAMSQLELDEVLFIPDGNPPHKTELSGAKDRLEMVRCAISQRFGFSALDIEVKREGQTFTVDTMRHLRREYPDDRFIYIIGSDTLLQLETWRNFDQVAKLLDGFACAPRNGVSEDEYHHQRKRIEDRYGIAITFIQMPPISISSTDVRYAAARGLPITRMVPAKVAQYIHDHSLYQDPMLQMLRRTLSRERYKHTLGVEKMAVQLAKRYGEDPEKARVAALLHDCARCMDSAEMKALIGEHADATTLRALMHAPAGAELARERYGIQDPAILSAIRWHTTGHENMTKLEKIVYLADFIEPNRQTYPGLEFIRTEAFRDLDSAVIMAAESSMRYVRARGLVPDENTLKMLKSQKSTEEI